MIHVRLRALWLIPLMLLPGLIGPSYAGIFFGRKNKKPTPAERVPALLALVKSDGDESKRAAAAQELRQYDPSQFPMIVPILVDVLLTDSKPGVRAEAAQSLGKIRPISKQAGMALEQALGNDSSMRVRLQARSSLLQYHWSGYHSVRKD
ncbi:MAG: HEAT repeat domain-containing protein, partial [Gemmataceae bacterium]